MALSPGRADLVASEIVAVVVAVTPVGPQVLTVGAPTGVPRLPSGPLRAEHRSLQTSLRTWVEEQTGVELGYVEQLYTFADRERVGPNHRLLSVSYLGLTRIEGGQDTGDDVGPDVDGDADGTGGGAGTTPGGTTPGGTDPGGPRERGTGATFAWRPWAEFLPWEVRRDPASRALSESLRERLLAWAETGGTEAVRLDRRVRVEAAFGVNRVSEASLQRYQLLHEARLTAETAAAARGRAGPGPNTDAEVVALTGSRMLHDHRRILATGVDRLRAKIQYRPVVFELVPPEFTLGQLQACVEDIAGTTLHTQNFRRLVQQQHLVEEAGGRVSATGGRPAKLYRFRREVEFERYAAGTKLPLSRGY